MYIYIYTVVIVPHITVWGSCFSLGSRRSCSRPFPPPLPHPTTQLLTPHLSHNNLCDPATSECVHGQNGHLSSWVHADLLVRSRKAHVTRICDHWHGENCIWIKTFTDGP